MQEVQIFRSRAILPVSMQPIFNGALITQGTKILAVGEWKNLSKKFSGKILDLGNQVILPGLINAHCHLDYTLMAGKLGNPMCFTSWIQSMIKEKRSWDTDDFRSSWISGYKSLIQSGTTLIADTLSYPSRFDPSDLPFGPKLLPLYEFIHLPGTDLDENIIQAAEKHALRYSQSSGGKFGISPHAPYTTTPELWQRLNSHRIFGNTPNSIHLSESAEEYNLFTSGSGPMFEWFDSIHHLPEWGIGSPIEVLDEAGVLNDNSIAIHVNYLGNGDVERLAQKNIQVVHCPRSHAYFKHAAFPMKELQSHQINIALGTDSLASMKVEHSPNSLDLFNDMRLLLDGEYSIRPESILTMATINGAKALGLQSEVGSLEKGKQADWISLPWNGKSESLNEHVITNLEPVSNVVVGGRMISSECN